MTNFSSLVELLRDRAAHQQNSPLYTFLVDGEEEEQTLNYSQLDDQAKRIGALLQQLELKGERALLLYPPGLEYIAAFFGCLYAGVIAVPAYPPDPTRLARTLPRLEAIVQDSKATAVLTTEMIRSIAEEIFIQAPDLAKLQWLATDQLDENLASNWKEPILSSESLAFLQYTSGSTGKPKGVMLTHGNLLYNSFLIDQAYEHSSESRGVIWLPPYHDMGLIGGIIQPLYKGFPCALMSPLSFLQKPVRWLQAITHFKGTTSGGPNFAYELCIRKVTAEQMESLDLKSWSLAFTGAEPISSATLDRFVNKFASCGFKREALYPCYGLAEGTLIVSGGKKGNPIKKEKIIPISYSLDQESPVVSKNNFAAKEIVGCGQSLKNQKVLVVNPITQEPCSEGEVGEIWVSGPSIALGYWKKEEETEKCFKAYLSHNQEGPFLRTGDIGFLKNEELFVSGRLKDLIIIRGQNHYPQDIELTVEQSHSALRSGCGAVFSLEIESEEQLAVVYELDRSLSVDPSQLDFQPILLSIQEAVSEQHGLQTYAIILIKAGTIPKTSSGKISRYACKQAFLEESLENLIFWKRESEKSSEESSLSNVICLPTIQRKEEKKISKTEIKNWLAHQLTDRLKIQVSEIDTTRSFIAYGLDSKDAVNLSGEIEDWLRCSFSPSLLWQYPTIDALTDHLSKITQASSVEEEGNRSELGELSSLIVEN